MVSVASMTIAVANGTMQTLRLFTRPLVAVAVAYALIIQVFVAALGPPLTVGSDPGLAVELCAHDAQGTPVPPSDQPDRPCIQHCIFWLASSSLALAAPEASRFQVVTLPVGLVLWPPDRPSLPQPSRYAIARPRGPPHGA